ncbi:MAG: hypothetical protein LBT01_05715 [Spirochaetaceae bacterium]|nr:hypothetical protein [Spirochaetaceae bacterium]
MKKLLAIPLVCALLLSCGSTTSLVERTGRLLDGSVFAYKTESEWVPLNAESGLRLQNITQKDGTKEILFSTPEIPYLAFYGAPPQANGIFSIKRVSFLAGNYGGWNEFELEAAGNGRLRALGADNFTFTMLGDIATSSVIGGKIRRENTRLIRERALEELQNRNERILFICDWMKTAAGENGAPAFANQDEFEAWWEERLFPKKAAETLPFPDEINTMRDNGSLGADWAEASSWIYTYYNWQQLSAILKKELVLARVP